MQTNNAVNSRVCAGAVSVVTADTTASHCLVNWAPRATDSLINNNRPDAGKGDAIQLLSIQNLPDA